MGVDADDFTDLEGRVARVVNVDVGLEAADCPGDIGAFEPDGRSDGALDGDVDLFRLSGDNGHSVNDVFDVADNELPQCEKGEGAIVLDNEVIGGFGQGDGQDAVINSHDDIGFDPLVAVDGDEDVPSVSWLDVDFSVDADHDLIGAEFLGAGSGFRRNRDFGAALRTELGVTGHIVAAFVLHEFSFEMYGVG